MRARIAREEDRVTGDYNAFWDERNYVKDAGRFKAGGAHLARPERLQRQAAPRRAPLGRAPGARRAGEDLVEPGRPRRSRQLRRGRPCGATRSTGSGATTCSAWTTARWTGRRSTIERENNEWVDYASWPVPGARAIDVRLHAGRGRQRHRRGSASGARPRRSPKLIVDDSSIDANVLVAAPQLAEPAGLSDRAADGARARERHSRRSRCGWRSTSPRPSSARCSSTTRRRRAVHRHARLGRSAESRVDLDRRRRSCPARPTRSRSSSSRTTTSFRRDRGSDSSCCRAIGCSRCGRRPARGSPCTRRTACCTCPSSAARPAFAAAIKVPRAWTQPAARPAGANHRTNSSHVTIGAVTTIAAPQRSSAAIDAGAARRAARWRRRARRRSRTASRRRPSPRAPARRRARWCRSRRCAMNGAASGIIAPRIPALDANADVTAATAQSSSAASERAAEPGDARADGVHRAVALQRGDVGDDAADEQHDAPGDPLLGAGAPFGKRELQDHGRAEREEADVEAEAERGDRRPRRGPRSVRSDRAAKAPPGAGRQSSDRPTRRRRRRSAGGAPPITDTMIAPSATL